MEEEKETKGTMETKRERTSGTEKEEERDRLSELPDCVLLHIMKFLLTEDAIQTCSLSKRWKNLWKSLTRLSFYHLNFRRGAPDFNKFVSAALAKRDHSVSLLDLTFRAYTRDASKLLNRVMEYAVLHNVQRFRVEFSFTYINLFDPLIFSCRSLTFLDLRNHFCYPPLDLPKSLHLPAVKTLSLTNVSFMASDDGCAEPFSTCSLLNILVLQQCFFHIDAKVLSISNSNLSSLKLYTTLRATNNNTFQHKIVLSTPNLRSLTTIDVRYSLGLSYHQLSSTCDLSLLEEGNIHTSGSQYIHSYIITISRRLQVFSNVKILTLNSCAFKIILTDLSDLATEGIQPPCFVRLESLKIKMNPYIPVPLSDVDVNRVAEYLLQNSPLAKVTIINC